MAKLKPVPVAPVEAPVVKKKSRMLVFIGIALLILGVAGGGAWSWLHQQPADPTLADKKPPVFVTLEPFTVNLLQEAGEHYLQVGIVYQVDGDKAVDAMKTYMPIIRNRILLLLSGKLPSELTQVDGKQKLVAELLLVARESLPEGAKPDRGIAGAFLSSFVIQ